MSFKKETLLKGLSAAKLYIFYFLIFFLPISKAAIEIAFALIFLIWFIEKLFKKGKIKDIFPKTELNLPIFAILVVCFLTIFNSVEPKESLRGFFGKWFEFAMLYFFTLNIIDSEKKFKTVLWVFSGSLTLISVDAIWQFISGKDFFYLRSLEQGVWIRGYFTSINLFAGLLTLIAPIVLTFLITFRKKYVRLYTYFLFSILFFCLLFSNSAETWIFISLSLIFGVFFYKNRRLFRYVILFLIVLWFIVLISFSFRERLISLKEKQIISSQGKLVGRTAIWLAVLQEVKNNPVLGKGINTTRASIIKKYSKNSNFVKLLSENHPHSLYLYILLECGILGLSVYLWFLYRIFKIITTSFKRDILSYGFFVSIVGFLGINLTDIMWGERLQGLFWVIIGLAVIQSKRMVRIERLFYV